MTISVRRVVATFGAGSLLTLLPLAFSSVIAPPVSHADCGAGETGQCGMSCPDGTVVDTQAHMCRDLWSGVDRSVQNIGAAPDLNGIGLPDLSALNGLPSPVQVNLPDVVLPGIGLGLVPSINLQPQLPGLPGPPQLPPPPNLSLPHF